MTAIEYTPAKSDVVDKLRNIHLGAWAQIIEPNGWEYETNIGVLTNEGADAIAALRAELEEKNRLAIAYAIVVEQFQKLLGVCTTTSALEKVVELQKAVEEARKTIGADNEWFAQYPFDNKAFEGNSATGRYHETSAWLAAHPAKNAGQDPKERE